MVSPCSTYNFVKHPELDGLLSFNNVKTSCFNLLKDTLVFLEPPAELEQYTEVHGLYQKKRAKGYIKTEYLSQPDGFDKWRVIFPKANGDGVLGDKLSKPFVIPPYAAFSETFLSVGAYETQVEAENLLRYLQTKFFRTLLNVHKKTQDTTRKTWKAVPNQDFSPQSDIDWRLTLAEIDKQLYAKYGLDEEEIAFIESIDQRLKTSRAKTRGVGRK